MPSKKGIAGAKGKGRATRPPAKRPPPRVPLSSDEEEPSLRQIWRKVSALEQDNVNLRSKLQEYERQGVTSSTASSNAVSLTIPPSPGVVVADMQSVPASGAARGAATQDVATGAGDSGVAARTSTPNSESSAPNTRNTLTWPSFGPWGAPPWALGQMWPFSRPVEFDDSRETEVAQVTATEACASVWQGTEGVGGPSQSLADRATNAPVETVPALPGKITVSQTTQTEASVETVVVQADPYASAKGSLIPYGSLSTPVGYHLHPSTKEKIWKGEYIDIFSLLFREEEQKDKDKDKDKEQERIRKKKVERTWANWLAGFLIFIGVVLQKHPDKAPVLIKYLDLIFRCYSEYLGPAWLSYDEAFRLKAAFNPGLKWDVMEPELWFRFMTPARPVVGDRADSGHILSRPAGPAVTRGPAGQAVPARLLCWEFSSKGACVRAQCKFRHECSHCGGAHPYSSCPRLKGVRGNKDAWQGGKPPPPSAGPVPKGPQPN